MCLIDQCEDVCGVFSRCIFCIVQQIDSLVKHLCDFDLRNCCIEWNHFKNNLSALGSYLKIPACINSPHKIKWLTSFPALLVSGGWGWGGTGRERGGEMVCVHGYMWLCVRVEESKQQRAVECRLCCVFLSFFMCSALNLTCTFARFSALEMHLLSNGIPGIMLHFCRKGAM